VAGPGNILIRVGAETSGAVRELGRVDKPLADVQTRGEKMGGAVRSATLPAVAALGALAVGAKKTADDARDLGESQNAVNVVFGEGADRMHKFAKIADKEAGLSMRAFNELVTPVGAGLRNVGFGADEAAKASIGLAKRAADMASVFNVDVSEALGAVQAGLRGEADPLERFGVGLSAAATQSKAMELGLAGSTKELTAQDLAQARLALIMDQTNKLQGDFKNTSDSAANASRVNAAAQENLSAKFGKGLLPVMEAYQRLVQSAMGFLGEHTTATKIAVGVVAALAAGVLAARAGMAIYQASLIAVRAATATYTGVQWLLNAALNANPIGIVIVAIAALAAGVILAYKKSETFRDVLETVWGVIKNSPLGILIGNFDTLVGWVKDAVEWIGKIKFPASIAKAFSGLRDTVKAVVDWISKIDFPSPPKWFGKLPGLLPGSPIGGAGAPRGDGPRGGPRSAGGGGSVAALGAGGLTINVFGATDPEGAARAIRRTLRGHDRRHGSTRASWERVTGSTAGSTDATNGGDGS
jgi:hypothetical protein